MEAASIEAVFLKILNMSITASWIVFAVFMARLLLRKAPKWIIVLMWGFAGIRLICPFSLESVFSLIPSAETVPGDILYMDSPAIHSGVDALNSIVNPIISESLAPSVGDSANPLQVITFVSSMIWIVGIFVMLVYTTVSYFRIRKKVREAMPFKDNIWICDHVDTPFILGVIRPRIYLPSAPVRPMANLQVSDPCDIRQISLPTRLYDSMPATMGGQDMEYVIAHEEAHLKRHDHWWKPLGFLLLTIYWFNPVLWIAYILLCRDIELACDEKVIRNMGPENKKPYSDALINCSVPRRMIAACPLAFGEVGVKTRVKSVLNYRKPAFWIIIAAVITCIIVAVCFLTDPAASIDIKLAVLIDGEIASHHQSEESENNFCCLDWEVIGKETDGNQTTIYMWVLYEEFSNKNGLKLEAGSHTLTAITVEENNGSYSLTEYWEPQDGSYYTDSIRKKIPMYLWSKALDSQRYIDTQSVKLENLARRHFCTAEAIVYFDTLQSGDILSLREQYPQYFDLDASNGLDVYVWQMAKNSFSFGLLPHAEIPRDGLFSTELLNLTGMNAKEMRQILSTYNIDENDISIIPWQNPISSYLGDYALIYEGESIEEKHQYYRELFRNMLFGELSVTPTYDFPIYDSLIFDVDGDGKDEYCILSYGRTSGLFTFTFSAIEVGAEQPKYSNVFCTDWYDLSFVRCEDGIVRVQGIDQKEIPQTHLFDIAVIDGNVHLTEDGRDTGVVTSLFTTEPQPKSKSRLDSFGESAAENMSK